MWKRVNSIENSQTLQLVYFRHFSIFTTKLHNFTRFRKLFSTVLKLFSNLKVCLIGEWSILGVKNTLANENAARINSEINFEIFP